MARPEPDFNMDQLLRQLQSELTTTEEGWTTTELAEAFGASRGAVIRRLKKLHAAGLLMRVRKKVPALDGREMTVVAYRLMPRGDGDSEDSGQLP